MRAKEQRSNRMRLVEEIVQRVSANNEKVILEVEGEPKAVVISVELYDQWLQRRKTFFDTMRTGAERANMSPEEADELAAEAVAWARKNKDA